MEPLRDFSGTPYTSPDNKPAVSGTPVIAHTSSGDKPGVAVGGYVIVNDRNN